VFTGSLGGILRRGNFRRDSGWAAAVGKLGVTGLHFMIRGTPRRDLPARFLDPGVVGERRSA
jgi:hypothetical protein